MPKGNEHFAGFSFPGGHAALALCRFEMFMWLGRRFISRRSIAVHTLPVQQSA
ncbi:MAG: hypothetical protein M3014_11700 [Chloroflexota bacterium]|nr:hypothetical protein [Chloroflexota bacterium]